MRHKILGLLAVGLLAGPMAANAVVIYQFSNENGNSQFSFESPTFIVSTTAVPAGAFQCSGAFPCIGVTLAPSATFDFVQWNFGAGGFLSYAFAPGAFSAAGVYNTVAFIQTGTLTVSETAVPEPGTLALLGLGLLGLGLTRRRAN